VIPKIIYEDKDLAVIDKPAGLPVHAANKNSDTETVVSFLISRYPGIGKVGENAERPGIVHRLDKETSGIMVVAKNNETFYELKRQFQQRKVEKKYIALACGIFQKESGFIDTPLQKFGPKTRLASRLSDTTKAKNAYTEYKVVKFYNGYTLLEIRPKTGRQHQIRVHLASINHPIACDKLYGRKALKCPAGLNRHFLHATYLRFRLKSALMEFESELPPDLSEALKSLD